MIHSYFNRIEERLKTVLKHEQATMKKAAMAITQSITNGGIVQLFGSGHSHMLAEEVFYRAGGLVPIKPILYEPLMLHEGAMLSSELERKNDYAASFMDEQDIQKNDVMIVISTSGRNSVPIDVAKIAKEKGAFVIGMTSIAYANSQPSRHPSGRCLHEVVDLVIDNHANIGDACLSHEKVVGSFSPTSTVIGATIINAVMAEVIVQLAESGVNPPIFISANLEGKDEHNQTLMEKHSGRIEW
ncbi:SIS domain-containing protein [Bacillus sp. FJAT-50079]|uniref:SIS domain-containing protein n=1 Tax=Bacillus sp. FJAT-50079 TaxID=2833577 RepID=UPI001BC919DE|nr:SIS domain-containing protein [Bacillus sp. FJAT-50079]MBS4207536.1 SIS domain-containing protein [Bacillus sp. FJAT-50079]